MTFNLIEDIRDEVDTVTLLSENCLLVTENVVLLTEEADRLIGKAIGALRAGKNPFEKHPGLRELIAGLMLLAKESNRSGLNIDQKKFDLITQFVDEKEGIKKYVSKVATTHGQSLIKNLDAHVQQGEKRSILAKKLSKLQQAYSTVKQSALRSAPGGTGQQATKKIA